MPEANLFAIKMRITAAKQTRKITSAMELIASSRLHRGKQMLSDFQDWAGHVREGARCLPEAYFEPMAATGGGSQRAYIVFGGSKGFSGSYAPSLFQYAAPIVSGHVVIAVGSAAEVFFSGAHRCFGDETPGADGARAIARAAKALYESGTVCEAYLLYNRHGTVRTERLLPLPRRGERDGGVLIEPSDELLFPELFDAYLEAIVYEAHLHAFIAEQIARVSAMDNATQNADKIIADLQSTYNRIRQSNITQEIIMVTTAGRGGGA